MSLLNNIRRKTYLFLLTLLANLLLALILTYARLIMPTKPTPDVIEYLPALNPERKIKIHTYNPPSHLHPHHGLDNTYCHHIATKTGHHRYKYKVLDVCYRIAPEHPFPAALEDISAVVTYVLAHPEEYDKSRISIGGFSAGANLAASITVNFSPRGTFWGLVLFCPVLDAGVGAAEKCRRLGESQGKGAKGRPEMGGMGSVPAFLMRFFQACYLAHGTGTGTGTSESVQNTEEVELSDPRVSPARADLSRFPKKCLFVTAEYD
ncbi:Alpha/Beta hydrolase protein [Aspergillus cavernicola]|uniref:Alpha/Beta hydrolase protein n=1 Tax=Aspergillus cavernicola TaxID=176166 RepID=A0ABR4IIE8_9EURO